MTKISKRPLNQPTPLPWSIGIAPVGNCEQVDTSVLNLIFQQAKVAGVGNLSKWRSEICSRCWSAPEFFEESPPLKMTESWADGPDWHLRSWSHSGLPLFSAVDMWIGSSIVCFQVEFNPWGHGAEEEACGCVKNVSWYKGCIPNILRPFFASRRYEWRPQ